MDTTKRTAETAKPGAAGEAEAKAPAPPPDERARARAYLDLWERHLAHVAVNGPTAQSRPPA